MVISRSPLLPALALALSAAGCSIFTRSIEKPTVEIEQVTVTAASLSAIGGALELQVENPNGFGVPLSSIDWRLAVAGSQAVRGRIALSQTIPARGAAPVVASFEVDPRDLVAITAAMAGGDRSYRIDATLTFSAPVGEVAVDIQHRGTIDAGGLIGRGVLDAL